MTLYKLSHLMVCPDYLFAKVGDVETYFTHTIHVRERVSPIVNLLYGCVPIVIEVGLITFPAFGSFAEMKTAVVVFDLLVIKITALLTKCH